MDDHPVIRLGIRGLFEQEPDMELIGKAGSGEEALCLVEISSPNVVLLDPEIPGLSGLKLVKKIREQGRHVQVLIFDSHTDERYARQSLASGASGYLVKEDDLRTIVNAVQAVFQGERDWVSPLVTVNLPLSMIQDSFRPNRLFERERKVLQTAALGKSNREIGQELGISEKTVEKHLEHIFAKLGAVSRVEAAVTAVRKGLL